MNKNGLAAVIISSCTILLIYFVHLKVIKWPAEQVKNSHWAEQAKVAPENSQLICPPSQDKKLIDPKQCKPSGLYDYDRQQRNEDHKAQVSMNKAVWLTTGITAVGLLLIGVTLFQAFKAATLASKMLTEAEKATKAAMGSLEQARESSAVANRTLEVTRETGIAQTRAYLVFEGASINVPNNSVFEQNSDRTYSMSGQAIIKNIGTTPAQSISYSMKVEIISSSIGVLFESDFSKNKVVIGVLPHGVDTAASNAEINTKYLNIISDIKDSNQSDKELRATRYNQHIPVLGIDVFYVTFRCEYSDVFENKWYIESTFSGSVNELEVGNSMSILNLTHKLGSSDKIGSM